MCIPNRPAVIAAGEKIKNPTCEIKGQIYDLKYKAI